MSEPYLKVEAVHNAFDFAHHEDVCNATAGVIVRRAFNVLGLRVKPYQGFSSVMHKYQVEPRSRLV